MAAKYAYLTASGLVKTGAGELGQINITKAGDATAVVTVYDNTAASGTKIAEFTGAVYGGFDFQLGDDGTNFGTGLYVALSGTTVPVVSITYN
jgi:hypothetical protein